MWIRKRWLRRVRRWPHARTRPYSLQHRKDEGKRKRYILVLMIVMLCVYIGALQKSGIVVCQKQFQAFVVGKLGRNYKKFQSMSGPNRCAVSLQLSFDLYSSTAGKDRYQAQKLLIGAGLFRGGGECVLSSGAGSVESEY